MLNSPFKEIGEGRFQNMTIINFSGSKFLTKVPNLSRSPNLKEVVLTNCKNLVEVHHSVGFLDKLVTLNCSGCFKLTSFPKSLKLMSLEKLYLQGCESLQNFPEIECEMKNVNYVVLEGLQETSGNSELPPKTKAIVASGCTSLERFLQLSKVWQFNTSDLQELKLIDLTGSHNIVVDVENFVPKGLLFQGYPTGHDSVHKDSTFSVIFPGSTMPHWFQHCVENSDDNSFEINVSALTNLDEISGIALYIVFGPTFIDDEINNSCGIHVQCDGTYPHSFFDVSYLMGRLHVWLQYITIYHIEYNSGQVRVYNDSKSMIIKSCGFYLVYKHELDAKDDLDMLHEDVDVNLECREQNI
ncbi:TMV resistance protein N [Morella rubra]|uniref:TMV resistance protein N n=1 Tax=Morella rubra TaxID=262757 RepID=A0A6A1VJF5_9ROSI|nr:TMV resistance protein N [Morella rubra]